MQEFATPMMKQYMEIKKQYKDCLLFFRLGDFYELFMEDAHIGSQVLGITLTARPGGKDGKIPMAGVPYHAVDSYLSKLVKAGYKVAICEQVTEPNSKGIVEREVVRVVTPGTLLDEQALSQKENNYICAINMIGQEIAFVYADISTGSLFARFYLVENLVQQVSDELSRTKPAECILPQNLYDDADFLGIIRQYKQAVVFPFNSWQKHKRTAKEFLLKHFKVATLASFNIADKPLVVETSACLLHYLVETQKSNLTHIQKITLIEPDTFVHLDRATIINLELFQTLRERDTKGSLLSAIDQTATAMGGRLLKSWVLQPLTNKKPIDQRLDATQELIEDKTLSKKVAEALLSITDIERVFARVTVGIGNARDLISISQNLRKVMSVKHALVDAKSPLLASQQKQISTSLWQAIKIIEDTIVPDPPIQLKEGGLIKEGIDPHLDKLRGFVHGGKEWIAQMEREERERTGISSLKLRFNKVFGYYIEISKANLNLAPADYIRKQTLVNGERFVTPALKEKEELILKSEDEAKLIEYEIYKKTVTEVLKFTTEIQKAASAIAVIDCLASNAQLAKSWRYSRPTILYSPELKIKDGRHPVVEQVVGRNNFVPNSINFSPGHASLFLITGPNMAGKSVYLRQTALITLLALTGSFVPAKSAQVSVVDAIFVRSGASDVITSGLSTFMVEMVETAYILNHATEKSLIIMDEIGRGTSTYDGVSIAASTAEYIATKYKRTPKTLFATHYFELTKLETDFPKKIKNIHMHVSEDSGAPVFLHVVKDGPASKSFGVAVAALAGVPKEVVSRANEILTTLESPVETKKDDGFSKNDKILNELGKINIDKMTPLKAINILSELKSISHS